MSILDNLTLPRVGEKGRRWLIGQSWQLDEAREMILRLGITRGCGVLMSATDVGDLALMCDRVLILRDGRVWLPN